jgi:branched-chain amino acid transport system permease protein
MNRLLAGLALLALIAFAAAPLAVSQGMLKLLAEILLVYTMAQMWNLLAGYAGLMSLGHQAFVGVGAYSLFFFANTLEIPAYYAIPVAAIASALAAMLIAPLVFRLRDAYFAIGMWVFAEILRQLTANTEVLRSNMGMPLSVIRIMDRDSFAAISYWCALALTAGTALMMVWLMRSKLGLGLRAVRDNELAAGSLGVDVWRARFIAFVLSATLCGTAGGVYFMTTLYVDPNSGFDVNWMVIMLFIAVIGGIGTLEGPAIGTAIYFATREMLPLEGSWYLVLIGGVAVATMLLAPRGIWGYLGPKLAKSRARRRNGGHAPDMAMAPATNPAE